MRTIEYIFGTGANAIILILIFFPTIAFIIQFIANIKIIKKLPEIEQQLKILNENLFTLTNITEIGKVEEIIKNEDTLENTKGNETFNLKTNKETIKYMILIILIVIIIDILIIIKFK